MSLKHLKTGSAMPQKLENGKLRMYSMAFCPYSERVRLTLAAKKIPYELVNINLHSKPDWYVRVNPEGSVPCLQLDDGRTLSESLVVSEYLDQAYGEPKLIPSDSFTSAQHKMFVSHFSKLIASFSKLVDSDQAELIDEFKASLDDLNAKLPTQGFLGGNTPAFADYMIWPWLERLEAMTRLRNIQLEAGKYTNLLAYIERMKKNPAVEQVVTKSELHLQFLRERGSKSEPNYDLALGA